MSTPLILPYRGVMPKIHPDAWIAPNTTIIGDVTIEAEASIWFGCVLRGDVQTIHVGERSNIQDGTIIHVTRKTGPTYVGKGVTIGHQALLHACQIDDHAFIGMGAIVMDKARVSSHAMLAAGALLSPGKNVPSGELWAGNPAKYFRPLKEEETAFISQSAENYVELAKEYK